MKINSGIVTIPVERDGIDAGSFSFNPENASFREKVYQLFENFKAKNQEFKERTKALPADEEVDELGLPVNIKAQIEMEKEIFRWTASEIDAVFGEGTSGIVFGDEANMFMLYQFMDEIAPYMEEAGGTKIERYVMNREQRRLAAKTKGKKVMR